MTPGFEEDPQLLENLDCDGETLWCLSFLMGLFSLDAFDDTFQLGKGGNHWVWVVVG